MGRPKLEKPTASAERMRKWRVNESNKDSEKEKRRVRYNQNKAYMTTEKLEEEREKNRARKVLSWQRIKKSSRGRNNGRSKDMTGQILPFARPEFSVITEMSGHFFSWTTGKDFARDTMKALEIVRTSFKRMSHFLINVQLISNSTDRSHTCWLISNLKNQI